MKRTIFITAIIAGLAGVVNAQSIVEGVAVDGFGLERHGRYMAVDMKLDLKDLDVEANRAVLLTPRLVNGQDSVELPSVGIYGRRRYYIYVRNGESLLTEAGERSFRASQKPDSLAYNEVLPYEEWMNGAEMSLRRRDYGCCSTLLSEQAGMLGNYREQEEFFPELVYERPVAEMVKSRSLEGSAYIDFPVNGTAILPDYRRNAAELGKIRATIDSVREDRDITITQVWLKGYASPESPYEHNKELAIGRTEALRAYIRQLYHFDNTVIATDYEPEDWDGLRRYVAASDLEHKKEILALIDSDREPDNKEWAIKKYYPEDYRYLLEHCYPALRHTDYRIAYDIRGYNDVDEIEQVLNTQPQKLSLNEFYLVAQKYEPGSEEYSRVFETAVRMYPDDETANLNAANAAMRRGDNAAAERYLAKAGDSPAAVYARGALAVRMKNYDAARNRLKEAEVLGVPQAVETLKELDNGRR